MPEWLTCWWMHFGSGSPRVFVYRESDCVGVLPCFLHEWNGARQLTLMGSGISDVLDPLFVPAHASEIVDCLREQLCALANWNVCDWQDLNADTPVRRLSSKDWSLQTSAELPCTEVPLEGTFEDFWVGRPRHLQRNVRRGGAKAREQGKLEFQETHEADSGLLHTHSWICTGPAGACAGSAAWLRQIIRLSSYTTWHGGFERATCCGSSACDTGRDRGCDSRLCSSQESVWVPHWIRSAVRTTEPGIGAAV